MKKVILSVVAIAAIAVGYQKYNQSQSMSDLMLANVEALANGESGGGVECEEDPGDQCKLSTGDILHGWDEKK